MYRALEFCVCAWLKVNPAGFCHLLSSMHMFNANAFFGVKGSISCHLSAVVMGEEEKVENLYVQEQWNFGQFTESIVFRK